MKEGSYYFKCLKYIYLFQKYLCSQKNLRILHPPVFYQLIFDLTLGLKEQQ